MYIFLFFACTCFLAIFLGFTGHWVYFFLILTYTTTCKLWTHIQINRLLRVFSVMILLVQLFGIMQELFLDVPSVNNFMHHGIQKLGIMLLPLQISSENATFVDISSEYALSVCLILCAVHFSMNVCSRLSTQQLVDKFLMRLNERIRAGKNIKG